MDENCEDWAVPADSRLEPFHEGGTIRVWEKQATLRRIGWIDQKGRVYTETPPMAGFDGGALRPLLIDARVHGLPPQVTLGAARS